MKPRHSSESTSIPCYLRMYVCVCVCVCVCQHAFRLVSRTGDTFVETTLTSTLAGKVLDRQGWRRETTCFLCEFSVSLLVWMVSRYLLKMSFYRNFMYINSFLALDSAFLFFFSFFLQLIHAPVKNIRSRENLLY